MTASETFSSSITASETFSSSTSSTSPRSYIDILSLLLGPLQYYCTLLLMWASARPLKQSSSKTAPDRMISGNLSIMKVFSSFYIFSSYFLRKNKQTNKTQINKNTNNSKQQYKQQQTTKPNPTHRSLNFLLFGKFSIS